MKSLEIGEVVDIRPIGENPRAHVVRSSLDGERVVFHLVSHHPRYSYDQDYGCKPATRKDCLSCPYRFECFTIDGSKHSKDGTELIQIKFEGETLRMFPRYWRTPEPDANELEAYLWGKSNGRLQIRTSRKSSLGR